jgi:hypothetical protein
MDGSLLSKDFKAGQLPARARGETGATGTPGVKGDKGDKGAPGATNVITRRGVLTTLDPGANGTVTVDCNPGAVATGGGIEIRNGMINNMVAWGSVPTPTDTSSDPQPKGWLARARNEGATGTIQVRAEVICASP